MVARMQQIGWVSKNIYIYIYIYIYEQNLGDTVVFFFRTCTCMLSHVLHCTLFPYHAYGLALSSAIFLRSPSVTHSPTGFDIMIYHEILDGNITIIWIY